MKRLAIFVEGQTERLFVEKLLTEITTANRLHIESRIAFGGATTNRVFLSISRTSAPSTADLFILLIDSRGDSSVVSDIRDQYSALSAAGYSAILGLRDIFPRPVTDTPAIRAATAAVLADRTLIPVHICFALVESEIWFIADYAHFQRSDASLTLANIKMRLGWDPSTDDLTLRTHPSCDLKEIYRLVGKSYSKKERQVLRILSHIDFGFLRANAHRTPDLKLLYDHLDTFVSP